MPGNITEKRRALDWYKTIYELIDMRSFSNLWYWIALAIMWSSASHWVLGVPFDIATRARRHGGQATVDLEDLVRINTNRLLHIMDMSASWVVSLSFFFLTALGLLGFYYSIEFAQAVFLLMMPMALVMALSIRAARKIQTLEESGEGLYRRLAVTRLIIQVIGALSIFVTSMWGMYQNFANSPLIG